LTATEGLEIDGPAEVTTKSSHSSSKSGVADFFAELDGAAAALEVACEELVVGAAAELEVACEELVVGTAAELEVAFEELVVGITSSSHSSSTAGVTAAFAATDEDAVGVLEEVVFEELAAEELEDAAEVLLELDDAAAEVFDELEDAAEVFAEEADVITSSSQSSSMSAIAGVAEALTELDDVFDELEGATELEEGLAEVAELDKLEDEEDFELDAATEELVVVAELFDELRDELTVVVFAELEELDILAALEDTKGTTEDEATIHSFSKTDSSLSRVYINPF
jgi:hypothetical protein